MPRSILLGRALPQPGEALFLEDDTAGVLALAEEERDACPSCGMPRAWCRDTAHQFAFDIDETVCWATYRSALRRQRLDADGRDQATQMSTHLGARFRKGISPSLTAGLDMDDYTGGDVDG